MRKIPLIVVCGPTASGKTGLAISIANAFNGEVVSADSMQIYKYMDIGTAKPTAEEQAQCRHHLIDIIEPDTEFSVADYCTMAHRTIEDIYSRNHMPVMCGGTGLYINSVVNDITFGEYENDTELREKLQELAERDGVQALVDILQKIDPVSAKRLHPNNIKRIIRAIEFYKVSGIPISEHQEMTKQTESRYEPVMLCIDHPRDVLYERINKRVDIMMDMGLADEVKSLIDGGYSRNLNSMQGIGYKELIAYFNGEIGLEDAVNMIKQNSRRYAKRQMTWFRRDDRIIYLKPEDALAESVKIIEKKLNGDVV